MFLTKHFLTILIVIIRSLSFMPNWHAQWGIWAFIRVFQNAEEFSDPIILCSNLDNYGMNNTLEQLPEDKCEI